MSMIYFAREATFKLEACMCVTNYSYTFPCMTYHKATECPLTCQPLLHIPQHFSLDHLFIFSPFVPLSLAAHSGFVIKHTSHC